MSFFGGPRSGVSPFVLAGSPLPWVPSYRYLGVHLDSGLTLRPHLVAMRVRALATFWQVCSWSRRERLPLASLTHFVHAYVIPSCLYGSELVHLSAARVADLERLQREIGRFMLQSACAPNAVVQGDLGWRSWRFLAMERAASLLGRLASLPASRLASRVFGLARVTQGCWSHDSLQSLAALGIESPEAFGLSQGSPAAWRRRYVSEVVQPRLLAADVAHWRADMARYSDAALVTYAQSVPHARLSLVHSWGTPPHHAAAWGRLRSGSSSLGAQRVSRHVTGSVACRLCGGAIGDLRHCLLACPALSQARGVWQSRLAAALGLSSPYVFSADVSLQLFLSPSSVRLASVHAAFAWEIEFAHRRAA